MNLYLFDENVIVKFTLPIKKIGDFWMTDNDGKNIVNICGKDNEWILSESETSRIIYANGTNEVLRSNTYYMIEKDQKRYILLSMPINDTTFESYEFPNDKVVKVGSNPMNEVSIISSLFNDVHYIISIENDRYKIQKSDNSIIYLNNEKVRNDITYCNYGDIINCFGFKIILAKGIIFINSPFNKMLKTNNLNKKVIIVSDEITDEEIKNDNLYSDNDYFLRSPRMRKKIEPLEMRIDSPPAKENMQETPLIMTLAPMLTMAASSLVTLTSTIQAINAGERTWKQSIPALIITTTMILSMFVWPFITRIYEKNQKKKREATRQEKYRAYVKTKNNEIIKAYDEQKKLLEDSYLQLNVCYDAIINKRRVLWERKIDQDDFLSVRIGKGQIPFNAKINYTQEDFSMDDDDLKQIVDNTIKTFDTLEGVPISYSFSENNLTNINGIHPKYLDFVNNIFLQLMAYHSYDNLKIVVFTNDKNKKRWDYLKESPYCFSNDKFIRFFATNTEEMQELSNYLEQIINNRKILFENGNSYERVNSYSAFNSYYLILVDDIDTARKIKIIENILDSNINYGFSIVLIEEKLSKVPSQINKFITIGDSVSVVINSEDNSQVRFNDEISNTYDMNLVSKTLSNLPLYIDNDIKQFPSSITFLELFSVGQIEQLNVLNRWKVNNPTKSLKTEIGVNENGDPFILDLHEKAHGPHGLVAGMTGSGKSELIITYVLSMAINYSPEEVAFVLIDYKGGGLAGAFCDSETGKKLPHIVGTITNLDKAEINRALSSIQSELRRRQEKFNEVRDRIGESTIDIYKYQKLYRDGVIREPIPHLIIVCDEFAELKDQQPEFMDDLISTARIGRSLGVHLILATQKPSGVVDGQIWSNSKFKICLKVQDKSDSMEMIKNDLAAELKNVGRFYLQVGYNEYFAQGQAAWAGAQYYPSKEFKKQVNKDIYLVDNTGNVNKSISNSIARKNMKSEGEELTSIVKYLIDVGSEMTLDVKQLWLDKLPTELYINNLVKKYSYKENRFALNPMIGEYDDPTNQTQGLLTLNISEFGNAIIYGISESGKDELLQTMIYSLITNHDSNEVNLYVVDFGAETLNNFSDAPQIGDVILSDEEEKLTNLIKLLNKEMNDRKKLFAKFNGNYKDYLKYSEKTIPNIVVFINYIEVMNELYIDLSEEFVPLIREGSKYGIYFIITTENQGSVRLKVTQGCKQVITLQLNNEMSYKDILGRTDGLVPSSNLGRGLIKLDSVVEFQSAFIDKPDSIISSIRKTTELLKNSGMSKARKIPIMPELITLNMLENRYKDLNNIPIGISKEALIPTYYNLKKNAINIVSANEMDNMLKFIKNIIKISESKDSFDKLVIDANNIFDGFNYKIEYVNSDFNKAVEVLSKKNDSVNEVLNDNNMNIKSLDGHKDTLCIILGFDKFYSKLSSENKELFNKILYNSKEYGEICFMLFDIPTNFKKYEYEIWFKDNINTSDGIWIGPGFTQQFLLKTQIQLSSFSNISSEYGVVIKNEMPVIIKLINEIK